ncbi:MAG: hypothetical protein WCL34_15650, partial [Methylococcaceae bacterium]
LHYDISEKPLAKFSILCEKLGVRFVIDKSLLCREIQQNENTSKLDADKIYLLKKSSMLESLTQKKNFELNELNEYVIELQKSKEFLAGKNSYLENLIAEKESIITELVSYNENLLNAKNWLESKLAG